MAKVRTKTEKQKTEKQKTEKFSLRQVVELAGLSEFTLRGWESRYGAFEPRRSSTGRRQYSRADVQKALALKTLTERGHKISEIAALALEGLEALLAASPASAPAAPGEGTPALPPAFAESIERHDWAALERLLHEHASGRDATAALREVVLPLLAALGRGVALGQISVAQEHIVSALAREQLFLLRSRIPRAAEARGRLLLASPEGDLHDLGLLVAHNLALAHGWQVLFLGPNTPKKDICEVAVRWLPSHVLVASTVSEKEGARESLLAFLSYLDRHLPRATELWVGGRNAFPAGRAPRLGRATRSLGSLGELDSILGAV